MDASVVSVDAWVASESARERGVTVVSRRVLTSYADGRRYDELTIHYPCGDWESYDFDPAEFADWAAFHRSWCPRCGELV